MIRASVMGAVIVSGFAGGYALRGALQPDVDRVAVFLDLFETHCVPQAHEPVESPTDGLIAAHSVNMHPMWVDPVAFISVWILDGQCGVDDGLLPMGAVEKTALADALVTQVPIWFPEAEHSLHSNNNGIEYVGWWVLYFGDDTIDAPVPPIVSLVTPTELHDGVTTLLLKRN